MKKLIIVLMMVAMTSFLLVGCFSGTTTPEIPTEPTEPTEPTVATTVAPIITAVLDADNDGYVNKAEVADGIVVNGTGPTYSEIKLFIDGVFAGTGDVTATGAWTVDVAKSDLGADGAKTLYATATEPGLAESDKSNEVAFTLDTAYPKIKSVKARGGVPAARATATETVVGTTALSAGPTVVIPANVVDGTWTVNVNAAAPAGSNVSITDPNGVVTWYTSGDSDNFAAGAPIPGVSFTLNAGLAPGQCSQIVCVAATPETLGRASLTFDEDVSFTQATTGNYTIFNNQFGWDILGPLGSTAFMAYNDTADTMFWQELLGWGSSDLNQGQWLTFQVDTVEDIAGNPIPVATPETANTVVLASTVDIAP